MACSPLRFIRYAVTVLAVSTAFLGNAAWALAQTTLSPSYAVVVGITKYQSPTLWPQLDTAEPDARAIQALLGRQGFAVTPLLGPNATREKIISTLRTLAKKIEADRATSARVVVYFAGHGTTETVAGTDYGYLVPWNATNDTASYVSMDDLRDISERFKTARHQLFLLDSCFGGLLALRDPPAGTYADQPGYLADAIARKAIEVLTAGGKDQRVVSNGPNGHSPFTGALLEALDNGLADTRKDGVISFSELVSYVIPRASNRYQTPGYSTLPGHGLGEFLFRSPIVPAEPARDTRSPVTPVFRSDVEILGPQPSSAPANKHWSDCAGGNPAACTDLGRDYHRGIVVGKDLARANNLYQKACDAGNSLGCADLGINYAKGEGLPQDLARANSLFQKSCDAGEALGCNNLGVSYERGEGLPQDLARANNLYQRACDAGDGTACSNLGVNFDNGRGVAVDVTRANNLYQKGCDAGWGTACNNLGLNYEKGRGVAQDLARASDLFQKGCDAGWGPACNHLGVNYENGNGVVKDLWRANDLYQKACDAAEVVGCYKLAANYEKGYGLEQNITRANALYLKACDGGHSLGCNNLGANYEEGRGIAKDLVRAKNLYEKACNGGEALGCNNLARQK